MDFEQASALREAALAARTHAYAPYSNFAVGAVVLMENGTMYSGCNVENASYGLTMCAERVAIGAALAAGGRRITALAVCGGVDTLVTPCGACRQVIFEFATPQTPIWCAGPEGWLCLNLGELLPYGFDLP